METLNGFQQTELIGRKLFKDFCKQINRDVDFDEGEFTHYDCIIKGKLKGNDLQKDVIGEIKRRELSVLTFPTYFMEAYKLREMRKITKEKNMNGIYINFFGDNYLIIWNIDYIARMLNEKKIFTSQVLTNRTTVGNSNLVDKQMILLPKWAGQAYKRVNGKWIDD